MMKRENMMENMKMNKIKITKDDFERYEDCRQTGITNMFLISNVMAVTGLDKEKIIYIMNNYSELRKKFT